jgi:multiple sugar transport system permease protein
MKTTITRKISVSFNLILASLLAAAFLLPMVYTFVSSLKSVDQIFQIPIRWIPDEFHWENYTEPLMKKNFGRYFYNSALVAIIVTASDLFLSSLAGYSLSKFNYKGRKLMFMGVLITMMVPIETTIVPLAIIVRKMGMMDKYWGLILPVMMTPFSIFWMRQFLITLPDAYAEAGRIDGLGEFQIFRHLILPLCKPALGALAIFTFMGNWNSLVWPLIVATSDTLRTLPVGLVAFQGEFFTPFNQLFAMAFLAVLPTFIFFMILRTRLIKGMAMVGIKG